MCNFVRKSKKMANYKELKVWHKAMDLATLTYDITKDFPTEEKYSLTDQMRRAAVSVPSNIAEGHARQTVPDFKHFLSMASGSLAELETQFELARRFGYIDDTTLGNALALSNEVDKMLWALSKNAMIR